MSQELYEKRAALVAEQQSLVDTAEAEGREMTAEENQRWDQIDADFTAVNEQIESKEAVARKREELARKQGLLTEPPQQKPPQLDRDHKLAVGSIMECYNAARADGLDRREALKAAYKAQPADQLDAISKAYNNYLKFPSRPQDYAALQVDDQGQGGSMVIPEQFVAQMIIGLDEAVAIRGVSTVFQVPNAESLGVPSLENDPADSDWTVELGTGSEDSTMSTGKRSLTPHPVAKRLKVSKTLIRKSAIPADALIRQRLGFKMAVTQEKAFLTGTGSQQPLGVFTASSQGISTSRDVSTDNTTTQIKSDGLIEAKYSLLSQYHMAPDLRWVFHRDGVKQIRKLKTGDGQYLWQPGMAADRPNTILDVPYITSEFAPNTFTTGQYVGIIGAWRFYWIADALSMTIQVVEELYAETNQNGYIMRSETDAMPVLEEAFARVTLA